MITTRSLACEACVSGYCALCLLPQQPSLQTLVLLAQQVVELLVLVAFVASSIAFAAGKLLRRLRSGAVLLESRQSCGEISDVDHGSDQ